jgi:hypothetical protein
MVVQAHKHSIGDTEAVLSLRPAWAAYGDTAWKYNGRAELFKVHCMHAKNYHNRIPPFY